MVLRAKSFNLRGEISTNSLPMPDATIFLNGVKKAQSDSSGNYVLRDLTQGTYQLSAQKQHYEFSPIETQLSSSTNANPSFSIKKYVIKLPNLTKLILDGENRFCQMVFFNTSLIGLNCVAPSTCRSTAILKLLMLLFAPLHQWSLGFHSTERIDFVRCLHLVII